MTSSSTRDAALAKLLTFAFQPAFDSDHAVAEIVFWGDRIRDASSDELQWLLDSEDANIKYNSWFVFDWEVDNTGTVSDLFLQESGAKLMPLAPEGGAVGVMLPNLSATVALVFAFVQITSAAWVYGKFGSAPPWAGTAHRISGRLAFIVSLPVAYHCLWSLGFQDTDTRVLLHSLLGCCFYGAFAAKVTVVNKEPVQFLDDPPPFLCAIL